LSYLLCPEAAASVAELGINRGQANLALKGQAEPQLYDLQLKTAEILDKHDEIYRDSEN